MKPDRKGTKIEVEQKELITCADYAKGDWYTTIDGKRRCYCLESGVSMIEDDYCSRAEAIE